MVWSRTNAELARLGQVSRARITQIMNLLLLAPDIQEEILFLPKTTKGHDPIKLRHLQVVALERDWGRQRERYRSIMALCHNRTRGLDPEDTDAHCK